MRRGLLAASALGLAWAGAAQAQGFQGDAGLAAFASQNLVQGVKGTVHVLPYLWGEWGPAYARIDTFGMKTLGLGSGALELVARVNTEGWTPEAGMPAGLKARGNLLPLGLGTMQRGPWGALFLYGLHDARSGGHLLEATWAGRLQAGPLSLYPQLGVEYRSAAVVRHLVGVSASEAQASGLPAYRGGGAWQPRAAVAAEWRFGAESPWALQAQARHTWLGSRVKASPLVERRGLGTGYLGLSYTLK